MTSGEVAAFLGEPIQGVGGTVTPPPEYFQIVYDIVRNHGGLCIADEVQTGFGRTGTAFWGFENWGVTPDLVTMAKGIGNGVPLVGMRQPRPEVAQDAQESHPLQHVRRQPRLDDSRGSPSSKSSTPRGSRPMPCVSGPPEDALPARPHRLRAAADRRRPRDGADAGRRIGPRPRSPRSPRRTETADVHELCSDRGLLVGKGGLYGNVLADQAADVLDDRRRRFPRRLPRTEVLGAGGVARPDRRRRADRRQGAADPGRGVDRGDRAPRFVHPGVADERRHCLATGGGGRPRPQPSRRY